MSGRTDRARKAAVEGALRGYEDARVRAEARACQKLEKYGFAFTSMRQVEMYLAKQRKLDRARADAIAEHERFTREFPGLRVRQMPGPSSSGRAA